MRRLVVKVLKNETILVVASILALISCFIVPPDKEYAGYIHASTISQLICLMLVVCGFQVCFTKMSLGRITLPSHKITAFSIACCSSRILPGQW